MNYILPLEKEREKYHFEISNDGKELKKSDIIPVVNDNKSNLQNGVIYVESPFQKDEYFDITEFNQKSQDKWREIIKELASKIGATKIKTTLLLEKEDSINSDENNEFTAKVSGNYKIVDGDASINNTNSSRKGHNEQLSSSLEFLNSIYSGLRFLISLKRLRFKRESTNSLFINNVFEFSVAKSYIQVYMHTAEIVL